jgi:hypothetical protein
MEGGGLSSMRRKVETGMTDLLIDNCLEGYPATVGCPDDLPAHLGVRPRTFIVNMDTCDRQSDIKILSSFPFKSTVEKSFTMFGSFIPRCLRLK